jgi:glyoxylase-like metal-dependent hydrolase (beta-lactamase superfamily II)
MIEKNKFVGERLSRREMMMSTGWAALGVASAVTGAVGIEALWGQAQQRLDESSSRIGWPPVMPLPPVDDHYPVMPTWKTELRQLAPNVYVYQQQGGTGLANAGISNAGLFVGEDWLVALDALGFPLQTKAFIAAAKQATGGKPFAQLINTHHHGDHVAGNQFFLPAQILSHPFVPYAHNGYVSKWLEAVDKIMKMDVDTIILGHGPVGGKKDLAEMAEYFRFLKIEAKKRFDAGMGAGRAAADIKMGKFDNWMGPERIVMTTVRLYDEFKGTLKPDIDMDGTKRAIEEYDSIKTGVEKRRLK